MSIVNHLSIPDAEFENSDVVISFMKENKSVREHSRGVEVHEDGLTIQTSGRYFIYSSIHFRRDSAYPCTNFTYQVRCPFSNPRSVRPVDFNG